VSVSKLIEGVYSKTDHCNTLDCRPSTERFNEITKEIYQEFVRVQNESYQKDAKLKKLEEYRSQCHQHINDLVSHIEAQKHVICVLEENLRETERQWISERSKSDEISK
jgi:predicted RNase H-like nuclease (RuvC/YqgF family)